MKGASQLITHSLFVLFSIMLLLAVITSMGKIEKQYSNFTGEMSARDMCSMLKTAIEKIYMPVDSNITVNKTVEMSYIILDLPIKMGSRLYDITFAGNYINITSEEIFYQCKTGINATLSGISHGGRTKIKWLFGNSVNSIIIENP